MLHIIETINTILNNFIWGIPAMYLHFWSRIISQHKNQFFTDP